MTAYVSAVAAFRPHLLPLECCQMGAFVFRLQIPVLSRWMDSRTTDGLTALHVAVQHDALECVLALIEAGASLMVVTGSMNGGESYLWPGTTPLHIAAQHGNVGIIQALLQVPSSAPTFTWQRTGCCCTGHSLQIDTLDLSAQNSPTLKDAHQHLPRQRKSPRQKGFTHLQKQ